MPGPFFYVQEPDQKMSEMKVFCVIYLTRRTLMSPGKSSPVIRTGLFLTGD